MSDQTETPHGLRQLSFKPRTTNPADWSSDSQLMYRASRVLFEKQTAAWAEMSSREGVQPVEDWGMVDVELMKPALLLTGFSIELLLKACALANGVNIKRLIKKSHRLGKLAGMAGFNPDADQSHLLDVLERAMLWSGLYPAPRKLADFDLWGLVDSAGTQVPDIAGETEALYVAIRSLSDRLEKARLDRREN